MFVIVLQLYFIHQLALARRQRRDLSIFESSCHLPTCTYYTRESFTLFLLMLNVKQETVNTSFYSLWFDPTGNRTQVEDILKQILVNNANVDWFSSADDLLKSSKIGSKNLLAVYTAEAKSGFPTLKKQFEVRILSSLLQKVIKQDDLNTVISFKWTKVLVALIQCIRKTNNLFLVM